METKKVKILKPHYYERQYERTPEIHTICFTWAYSRVLTVRSYKETTQAQEQNQLNKLKKIILCTHIRMDIVPVTPDRLQDLMIYGALEKCPEGSCLNSGKYFILDWMLLISSLKFLSKTQRDQTASKKLKCIPKER